MPNVVGDNEFNFFFTYVFLCSSVLNKYVNFVSKIYRMFVENFKLQRLIRN